MAENPKITKETKILNIGHLPGHTNGKVDVLKAGGFENSHAFCMTEEGTTIESIKEELRNSPHSLFIVGGAMNSSYPDLMKELNEFIAAEVPSIIVHNTTGADFPPGTTYPPSQDIVNDSALTIANRYLSV